MIILQDLITLRDALSNGKAVSEVCYESGKETTIKFITGLSSVVITLTEAEEVFLYKKVVDKDFQYCVMIKDDFIGNRMDIIDQEYQWIFKKPEGNWTYSDLNFADNIEFDDCTYTKLHELHSCLDNIMYSFAEYTSEVEYNRLVVLETGDVDNENGGLIEIYQGYLINNNEVEIV